MRNRKIQLNKRELFWHYSVVLFLLVLPSVDLYYEIKKNQPLSEIKFSYLFIFFAVIMFYIQRNKLKFKTIQNFYSLEIFDLALKKTAKELNWVIDYRTNDFMRAHRKFDHKESGSWGEMITINRIDNVILINSICNPNGLFISLFSYGRNKQNINQFVINLEKLSKIE